MANNAPTLGAVVSNNDPAVFPGREPLTGQHVTLERLTPDHFPDLYKNMASYDNTWTYLSDGPFGTSSEFVHWLNPSVKKSNEYTLYSVILRSGPSKGQAAGIASLINAQLTHRVIELGLLFGPPLQKTRAGTEVVFLLGRLLFDELNYRRLEWKCDSLNRASQTAAERYGFVYEGTFRQHQITRGRNRDSCWFSIVDAEWPVCRDAFEKWLEDENFDSQGRQRRRMQEIRKSLR